MKTIHHHFKALLTRKFFALGALSVVFFVLAGMTTPPQALAQSKGLAASSVPNSRLLGSGTLRWLAFKVYDARLYAPIELASAKNWQQVPLALQLTYARSIKGEQIAQTSADEISRLGTGDSAKIAAWSTAMKQLFPDVKEGDQIVGVYKPNQSVAFFLNGKPLTISSNTSASNLGPLSDPSFGKAFFAIWLDTKTRDQGLRKALLGQLADEPASGGSSSASNLNSPASTN
jgi:Chalcone isomerase-like